MNSRFLLFVWLIVVMPTLSISSEPEAKIVSIRPGAFIQSGGEKRAGRVAMPLVKGEIVETDATGRVSILLPNHLLLKLSGDTTFQYHGETSAEAFGDLKKGTVWLRGDKREADATIRTPSATTAIRGTEWYVTVDSNGETTVGVLDGRVAVSNEHGSLMLTSKEMAVAAKGKAPVKSIYLVPENAVNWTLTYTAFWDQKDLNRADPYLKEKIGQAIDAFEKNDLQTGFSILKDTEKKYGGTAPFLALKGFLELISGNGAEADKAFYLAHEKAPEWAFPVAHLALMKLVQNDLDAAEKLSGQAVDIEPQSPVALIVRAYVKKGELKLEEANAFSKKAVELSPAFDPASIAAARIALEMEDFSRCRKLLQTIPPGSFAYAEKETLSGYLELSAGNPKKALAHFDTAIKRDPEQVDGLIGKGIAHFNLNETDPGMESILRATLVSPQMASAQCYLAKAAFEEKSYESAVKSLERAKRLDPKDPTPHLYESLYLFEKHLPGKALHAMNQARRLNRNRAVFRSQYLLDRDQAVLMSNVAGLYQELGFKYTSIRNSTQAIERHPLNPSAYRRLFFSEVFSPQTKPLYMQCMETDKLIAKMLVPPTLNGVIFTPEGLSPYQPLFSKPGVDFLLSGYYIENNTRDSKLKGPGAYFSAAFKPKSLNLAGSVAVSPSDQKTDTEIDSLFDTGTSLTETSTDAATDLDTVFVTGFMKYQIHPRIGFFSEVQSARSEISMNTVSTSLTSMASDYFSMDQTSTTDSDSDTKERSVMADAGFHIEPFSHLHWLTHFSRFNTKDDVESHTSGNSVTKTGGPGMPDTTSEYPYSGPNSETQMDTVYQIAQTTFFKQWGNRFFETGFRRYSDESEMEIATETTADPATGATASASLSGTRKNFTSAFFSHRERLGEILQIGWGVTHDWSRYREKGFDSDTHSFFGYHGGTSLMVTDGLSLRAAYVKNSVGDGEKRLQQAHIAGFPLFTKNSFETVASSPESRFYLTHKTLSSGIDYEFQRFPLFTGIEYAWDRGDSFRSQLAYPDLRFDIENEEERILAYVEALLSESIALSLSARFSDISLDEMRPDATSSGSPVQLIKSDGDSTAFQSALCYFTPFGMSVKGQYLYKKEDLLLEKKTQAWLSEVAFYLLKNRVRLMVQGKREVAESSDITQTTRQVGLYGYWYY